MKILIIGATGHIGKVAAAAFLERDHEILRASRSSELSVDITETDSIHNLFERIEPVDAVIVSAGAVPFKPLAELSRNDYLSAFLAKTLGQIEVAKHALDHVNDRGSVTLTSGILAREPIATGAAAAMANGALESFVIAAAAEACRGIRINAVSPNVLASAPSYHSLFPGQRPVTDDEVGRGYVLAVESLVNGRTIAI